MAKYQLFASQCEGKEKHTAEIARMIVRKASEPCLEAYKCPHCRKWHVGRKPKKNGKPKR